MAQWLSGFIQKLKDAFRPFWRETLFGLVVQVGFFTVYMLVLINVLYYPDYNDMGELVLLGVQNLASGINPYGKSYVLTLASLNEPRMDYELNAFYYGPVTLVAHLPVVLFPLRFDGLGKADFMPSFVALQVFFTFLLFWCLSRMGQARFGLLFWANPFFIPTEADTFFVLPMLLVLLGLQQIEQARRCILWLSLAAATYHLTVPLLFFAMVYHRARIRDVVEGVAPVVLLTSAFVLWSALEGHPLQLLQDLLFSQASREYLDWNSVGFVPVWEMMGSIPVVLYNLLHVDVVSLWTAGALSMSSLMMLVTGAIMALLGVRLALYPSAKNTLLYGALVTWLFIISMPGGLLEYYVILVIPVFFVLLRTGLWVRLVAGFRTHIRLVAIRLSHHPTSQQSRYGKNIAAP